MRAHPILLPTMLAASAMAYAHQNTPIEIRTDGELVGLPTEYSPASLKFQMHDSPEESYIESIEIYVSGAKTKVPSCASALMMSRSTNEIYASASWYHQRSSLPPYLNVTFLDPGSDPTSWPQSKFSLTFNLENSKLIEMVVFVARKNPDSEQRIPIDLSSICPKEQLEQFYSPHKPASALRSNNSFKPTPLRGAA